MIVTIIVLSKKRLLECQPNIYFKKFEFLCEHMRQFYKELHTQYFLIHVNFCIFYLILCKPNYLVYQYLS